MNAPVFAPQAFRAARDGLLDVFVVAGEPSGDLLGASLMQALAGRAGGARFAGIGGPAMQAQGLTSLLPLADIAVMGILPVLRKLPHLIAAVRRVAEAVIAARPDVLVIIDSPDFTHRVAKHVRRARPDLPIVDYVSPSVWAWRSGRARQMRAYVDHVLALLPFEPAIYERLGGPDCTYVGHPLIEQTTALQPNAEDLRMRDAEVATLVVMPGSRESEIRRLMPVFGAAIASLREAIAFDAVLPTLPHLQALVRSEVERWPLQPRIIADVGEKYAAMRGARAALVASGTATLELALACVPMVAAYRVSRIEELVARLMLNVDQIALPNLILDRRAVPEFVQDRCTPRNLAQALRPLVRGGTERAAQLAAFGELASVMKGDTAEPPSARAAYIVERIALAPLGARSNVRHSPSA
jgi:lipid-A-disaccharide synthase